MQDGVGDSWLMSALAERRAWCRRFAELVGEHQDQLCALMTLEVRKPYWQALTADVMSLLASCRWHAKHAERVLASRGVRGRPLWMLGQRARVERTSLGTVGIIATWNYPVQLLGIQVVQALMAGNRVVVKPSERAPRTQELLLNLAVRAGLPEGTLRWTAATREAGQTMLASERLDHLVFTGSTRVGRQIAAWAAEHLVPTTLELSGCDSAIVLDDADVTLAARTIWGAVVLNGGQTCMAPRRVLVERGVYRAFVDALSALVAGSAAVELIDEAAAMHAMALVVDAVAGGGRTLTGVLEPARGRFVRPAAVAESPRGGALVRGDHFGPVLAVVPVADADDAIAVHRQCDQHLALSVYTGRPAVAAAIGRRAGAGFVTINDTVLPVSHPGAGLGGRGLSGWGVSRGEEGLLAMTRPMVVTRTSTTVRTPSGEPDSKVLAKLAWFSRRILGGAKRSVPVSAGAVGAAGADSSMISRPSTTATQSPGPSRERVRS